MNKQNPIIINKNDNEEIEYLNEKYYLKFILGDDKDLIQLYKYYDELIWEDYGNYYDFLDNYLFITQKFNKNKTKIIDIEKQREIDHFNGNLLDVKKINDFTYIIYMIEEGEDDVLYCIENKQILLKADDIEFIMKDKVIAKKDNKLILYDINSLSEDNNVGQKIVPLDKTKLYEIEANSNYYVKIVTDDKSFFEYWELEEMKRVADKYINPESRNAIFYADMMNNYYIFGYYEGERITYLFYNKRGNHKTEYFHYIDNNFYIISDKYFITSKFIFDTITGKYFLINIDTMDDVKYHNGYIYGSDNFSAIKLNVENGQIKGKFIGEKRLVIYNVMDNIYIGGFYNNIIEHNNYEKNIMLNKFILMDENLNTLGEIEYKRFVYPEFKGDNIIIHYE